MGGGKDFSFSGGQGAGGGGPVSRGTAGTRFRWRLGLRVVVLLGVLSLVAGAWFWWRIATAVPEVTPLSAVTETGTAEARAGTTTGEGGAAAGSGGGGHVESGGDSPDASLETAVVHVAGAVKNAGVVKLPNGSRVHDAILAAGGGTAAADLNLLNLAAVLEDGQKIYVPRRGEPIQQEAGEPGAQPNGYPPEGTGTAGSGTTGSGTGPGSGASDGAGGTAGPRVNLNTATAEELGGLPRVGPVLAQRIVDWRTGHGRFKTVEELDAVDGIGPKMLETLLPLVTV
jgi:competence protein ComEA